MSKKRKLSKLKIDRRVPIVAIHISYNPSNETPDIKIADYTYEIISPSTGLGVAIHITQDLLSRISAAKGLMFLGFENPSLPDIPSSTWPQQWKYLSQTQLKKIEDSGFPVISHTYILTESLQIGSFAKTLYHPNDIINFFDSWIEIMWQEYVIETELRRYQKLQKRGQPAIVTINQPNEINLQNADTWIPLENCMVRIRSIWERIHKTIIPLYLVGSEAPENTKMSYWKILDTQARKMLNQEQIPYYELIKQAIVETIKSPLKSMRDDLIHKLSHRPIGVVPARSISNSSLPHTVDELQHLILTERSRYREALILITAMMRAKTPVNKEITAHS